MPYSRFSRTDKADLNDIRVRVFANKMWDFEKQYFPKMIMAFSEITLNSLVSPKSGIMVSGGVMDNFTSSKNHKNEDILDFGKVKDKSY